jgi:hypothetical protein
MGFKNCYRHIILVKFCTKERFKGDCGLKFSKTHQDEKRDSGEK